MNISMCRNNRDLNQGILHLWPKYGDPSLNGWWFIALTIFQDQNGLNFTFKLNLTLQVKVDYLPNNRDLKVFCTFVSNLVILAWTVPCYRADKQVTDTHMDTHRWQYAKAKNWPRVKKNLLYTNVMVSTQKCCDIFNNYVSVHPIWFQDRILKMSRVNHEDRK